jgi:hypothetical protein
MKRHKLAVVLAVVLIPAVAVAVGLIYFNGVPAISGDAKDAKGCEGLSDYREEVFAVWSDSSLGLVGPELLSLSSDDWRDVAAAAVEFQRGFKQIDPPVFAAEWQQALTEGIGMAEQMALAIADGGLFVVLGFEEQLAEAEEKIEAAVKTGTAMCADFSDFARDYEALKDEGGTPAAELTPSTAGTPRAG